MKKRRLIPEVVQISSTDCGPAVLKAMLEGHGISASYGRLREACQTGVDGTSINAIEALLKQAGLEATQTIIPIDHLLLDEAKALPAVVVLRLPNDLTHFVVVWSKLGPFVQVMDPATGRRWMPRQRLLQELFDHWKELPAAQWRTFAGSQSYLRVLARRMRALGIEDPQPRFDQALADPTWRSIAELDAGVRMVEALAASDGIDRGPTAIALLDSLLEQSAKETLTQPSAEWTIPIAFRSVLPAPMTAGGAATKLLVGGAVAVTVRGPATTKVSDETSPELAAALREPPPKPWRDLFGMLKAEGVLRPLVLMFALFAAAVAVILEALLFRALFELGDFLVLPEGRLHAGLFLALFLVGVLLLELPITNELQRLGRSLEARLRTAFLEKLPKLADRYLQSRATSDMADRCHAVYRLRLGPYTAGQIVRDIFELIVTVIGLAWLDPRSALPAMILAVVSVVLPIATQPLLAERDLRMRSHLGALSRFYLDAMLGLIPIRTHGAERAVRREHEMLVVDWTHAAKRLLRATVAFDGTAALATFALATWVFMAYVGRAGEAPGALLFLYWALNLPVLGQNIAGMVRNYSPMRSVAMRLLEPLGAVENASSSASVVAPAAASSGAASIRFESVEVIAAGQTILRDVNLSIAPGEHIGVVGPSGAGKSSFVGLLLGWHEAAKGSVFVDGAVLEGAALDRLRTETAWVDPAVQLWNRSLLENLLYGAESPRGFAKTIDAADLRGVLEAMPNGLQTSLGEGGALVSGGEGQRVRLGRAMMRHNARLVLLDEPFRGLDREKRIALLARARELWAGVTLICVTHDISETLGMERVLVIDGGRVVDDGKPSELAATATSRYRKLLDAELAVQERTWSNKQWRKIRVERGQIGEPK